MALPRRRRSDNGQKRQNTFRAGNESGTNFLRSGESGSRHGSGCSHKQDRRRRNDNARRTARKNRERCEKR